jgi:hypothetical protein
LPGFCQILGATDDAIGFTRIHLKIWADFSNALKVIMKGISERIKMMLSVG